jgi:DNA-binding XRE family transcriptional regulator
MPPAGRALSRVTLVQPWSLFRAMQVCYGRRSARPEAFRAMPPRADPQVTLGAAIKQLREDRGLSQEAVALVANVHQTWMSRLECGTLNPSWGMVARVAAALGVEVSDVAKAAERLKKRG